MVRTAMSAGRQLHEMSTPTIVLVGFKQSPRRNENIIVGLEKMLFHVKQIAFERECHSNARVVRTVIEHSNGAAIFALK